VALPVERSDLETIGMPSPQEKRRAVFSYLKNTFLKIKLIFFRLKNIFY
jgi:hypothetical protein